MQFPEWAQLIFTWPRKFIYILMWVVTSLMFSGCFHLRIDIASQTVLCTLIIFTSISLQNLISLLIYGICSYNFLIFFKWRQIKPICWILTLFYNKFLLFLLHAYVPIVRKTEITRFSKSHVNFYVGLLS